MPLWFNYIIYLIEVKYDNFRAKQAYISDSIGLFYYEIYNVISIMLEKVF